MGSDHFLFENCQINCGSTAVCDKKRILFLLIMLFHLCIASVCYIISLEKYVLTFILREPRV